MNNATEILLKYGNGEISLEAANKALDEMGAGYHLEPSKATDGWTEAEMKEGFLPGEKKEDLPDMIDGKRRKDLAGQTVIQRIKGATYAVSYDEDGYFVKAVRQK